MTCESSDCDLLKILHSHCGVPDGAGVGSAAVCTRRLDPNPRRRPEYRLATEFWRCGDRAFVVKRATAASGEFLKVIARREQEAAEYFDGHAEVVTGRLCGRELVYEFFDEPSLEVKMRESLQNGGEDAGSSWLDGYARFVRSLPSRLCRPVEFFRELGLPVESAGSSVTCLAMAPIDLIPSNILVGSGGWRICDNEFFFDWALPRDLVIYRGVTTLANRVQQSITSKERSWEIVPLSGGGRKTVFVPQPWLKVLKDLELSLRSLGEWSWRFEGTILYRSAPSFIRPGLLRHIGQSERPVDSVRHWIRWALKQAGRR